MSWEIQSLGSIADLCLGKMLDQKKNKGVPRPYLANINVRWGSFDLSDLREMRFEDKELDRYGLRDGDIVMCEGGEPGRCAIWRDPVPGMMFQKALHRIRPYSSVDTGYLYYALLLKGRSGGMDSYFTGATIKHLPGEQLAKIEVALPPLETQRRIAGILGAYDDLIEVNRRRIAVLEEMARRLFTEWFVQLRFPEHEDVTIEDTPDGPLPAGWTYETIASVAAINAACLRPASAPAEIGYIDIASVSLGRIDVINRMSFSDAPGRARRRVRDGSIMWSNVRPNRRSFALVLDPTPDVIVSTGFTVLDAHETPFVYLYQWVTTDEFVGYLVGNAQGAAYPAVTSATFERAMVLLPPNDLMVRYAAFAEPMLRLADKLQKSNANLAAARDLLLPRLISGQLSVTQAEQELEAA